MTKCSNHHPSHNYVDTCLDAMKADGARLTKTRKAVLDCLSKTKVPLGPNDIMEQISKRSKGKEKIDLVSVYRILKYLADLSLVHQVGKDGGYFPCEHSHCSEKTHVITHCTSCNSTTELHVPQSTSSSLVAFLKKEMEFKTDPHAMEVKGICKRCLKDAA